MTLVNEWKYLCHQVERLGKLEEEAKKSRGWFSGWWGSSSKEEELEEGTAISK